jgi:hypothetical protein
MTVLTEPHMFHQLAVAENRNVNDKKDEEDEEEEQVFTLQYVVKSKLSDGFLGNDNIFQKTLEQERLF